MTRPDHPAPAANDDRRRSFIEEIIEGDVAAGKNDGRVVTRFPPEPNGYLHIGHAKSICLNFGVAARYGGHCNLRFDDTNPIKEEMEFVDSIKEDVRWLGFDWGDRELYASDYFEQLHGFAVKLIHDGAAYVDDLSAEQIRELRGTLTEPGKNSPFRDRGVEENLDLFARMRAGEFPDGSRTLRAKIDMASPNISLRDPVLYRILRAHHHRTADAWRIYPMYDFAHGQSDSIEKITHSLCTLEFEDHRPLYDWFIESLGIFPSRQYEFARLNLSHTLVSKRKLLRLVQEGHVSGWDDPRMPTLSGLRRRGFTPAAIERMQSRRLCQGCGLDYNLIQLRPKVAEVCDNCGGRLVPRDDDTPAAIRKRLADYREKTAPILALLQEKELIVRVDATPPPDVVQAEMRKSLGLVPVEAPVPAGVS